MDKIINIYGFLILNMITEDEFIIIITEIPNIVNLYDKNELEKSLYIFNYKKAVGYIQSLRFYKYEEDYKSIYGIKKIDEEYVYINNYKNETNIRIIVENLRNIVRKIGCQLLRKFKIKLITHNDTLSLTQNQIIEYYNYVVTNLKNKIGIIKYIQESRDILTKYKNNNNLKSYITSIIDRINNEKFINIKLDIEDISIILIIKC